MSVLSHVPALVLGGNRAVAKLKLTPRATVVLSRAAVSKDFISAGDCGRKYGDLPMRRTTHSLQAGLTAISATSVDRLVSCGDLRFRGVSTRGRRHSGRCRVVSLH